MKPFATQLAKNAPVQGLVDDAIDFAQASGVVQRTMRNGEVLKTSTHAPFTLFPSLFPASAYHLTRSIQNDIHLLYHKVSLDMEFLGEVLKSTIAADDFVSNLFDIAKLARASNTTQKMEIGAYRSDYMIQQSYLKNNASNAKISTLPKQIEINTMSAASWGLSTHRMTSLHKYNLRNAGISCDKLNMPENGALDGIARVMVEGWKKYGNPKAVFVFMVFQDEMNIYDQRAIEYAMYEYDPAVKVRRKVFDDCISTTRTDQDGKLFIDGEEVAVVYFRTGYSPRHFPTPLHWEARKTIEMSLAIKSPSAAHQLVGCKKLQEVLARPGVLEIFLEDKETIEKLRSTFAEMHSLDMNNAGDTAVKLAMERPRDFVLKPQREGGGNNLYDSEMVDRLTEIGGDERRCAYILMEKIRPPVQELNYFIHNYTCSAVANIVSEFSIYGVFLTDGSNITESRAVGHLLRSKSVTQNEGGISAGIAALDSPFLN
ncbi:glutathione synthetase-like [Ciona intestinalis]